MAQDVPAGADGGGEEVGLSVSEDREMRQLSWFSAAGSLSEASRARLQELRERDRRDEVRDARPDPSCAPGENPAPSRLEADRVASITCPNCGAVVPAGPGRSTAAV